MVVSFIALLNKKKLFLHDSYSTFWFWKKKRKKRKKKKDGDVQFHKNTDQTTAAKTLTASLAH